MEWRFQPVLTMLELREAPSDIVDFRLPRPGDPFPIPQAVLMAWTGQPPSAIGSETSNKYTPLSILEPDENDSPLPPNSGLPIGPLLPDGTTFDPHPEIIVDQPIELFGPLLPGEGFPS
jgi:hypothetical protein